MKKSHENAHNSNIGPEAGLHYYRPVGEIHVEALPLLYKSQLFVVELGYIVDELVPARQPLTWYDAHFTLYGNFRYLYYPPLPSPCFPTMHCI
jgi:hypothetical protein